MSVSIKVDIRDKDNVERTLKMFPAQSRKYLTQGIHGAIFRLHAESQKQENLQFKKPTHTTRLSFGRGIELRTLYGSIRPMTYYSIFVHQGTRFIKANPFMDRIAESGSRDVDKEINKSIDALMKSV